MEEHRLALSPGFQIEHFRIESVLGKGGFGITYAAQDLQLSKRVAVKELLPDSIATRVDGSTVVPQSHSLNENWMWARDRFLEEARLLAGFSHPSIVGVHRLIEANGTVYMVMDYVDGESYEALLRRIGSVQDESTLVGMIVPILEGLNEVHSAGILHRDIKPENILINRHGQPVLIDFGSARSAVGATMTMTSIVTHGYSPIEQYQTKGRMGPWTDIYALGAVICRAMTGDKPPVAADRLMDDEFQWVSNRGIDGYSEGFCNWVDWALRIRPEERPQSISQWEQAIELGKKARQAIGESPPPLPPSFGEVTEPPTPEIRSDPPDFTAVTPNPDGLAEPPPLPISHWPMASSYKRLGAGLIDLSAAIILGLLLTSISKDEFQEEVAFFLPIMGFVARDSLFSGRSLGRWMLGLQVRRITDGLPVSFLWGIWRNLIPFLVCCATAILIGLIYLGTGSAVAATVSSPLALVPIALYATYAKNQQRTLLDRMSKTIVVNRKLLKGFLIPR
jgi:serine/threonine protein kinase